MAVTITVAQLAGALRVGDGTNAPPEPINASLTRYLSVATEFVTLLAPGAPEAVQNEAVVRICGYLLDAPTAARGDWFSSALRNSGALSLLNRWRVRRAGETSDTDTGGDSGGDSGQPAGPTVDTEARRIANLAESTATDALNMAREALRDLGDLLPLVTAAANPQAATDAEADAATETGLRSWSAALIRRVVEAIVPSWARAASPPEQEEGIFTLVGASDVTQPTDNNRFVLANVDLPDVGKGVAFFTKTAAISGHAPSITIAGVRHVLQVQGGGGFTSPETQLPAGDYVLAVRTASNTFESIAHPVGTSGAQLADGAVTTDKLADNAVTQPKIADDAVGPRELATDSVRTGHLADNAVESAKIPSNAILTKHIAADQVTRGEMAADSVGTTEIVDGNVTEAKLDQSTRDKLNTRATGGADTVAREAAMMAATAAAAAQLDADTVIEISPAFTVGETAARNINVDLRHPLNAYSQANILSVSVQGGAPVLVEYNPRVMNQTLAAEIPATIFSNIAALLVEGGFIDVTIRLTQGRNGPVHFNRIVSVPVEAAPGGLPTSGAADGKFLGHARGAPAWVNAPEAPDPTYTRIMSDSSASSGAFFGASTAEYDTMRAAIADTRNKRLAVLFRDTAGNQRAVAFIPLRTTVGLQIPPDTGTGTAHAFAVPVGNPTSNGSSYARLEFFVGADARQYNVIRRFRLHTNLTGVTAEIWGER